MFQEFNDIKGFEMKDKWRYIEQKNNVFIDHNTRHDSKHMTVFTISY